MKHVNNLLTPAQCLLRALQLTARPVAVPHSRQISRARSSWAAPPSQISPVTRFRPEDKLAIFIRDEKIDTSLVRVKRPDGSLGPEEALRNILRSIDRGTQTVIQVSKPGAHDVAVVEVANIMELRQRVRRQEEDRRHQLLAQKEHKPKHLELNWAISEHDLELKLKQLEQFVVHDGKKVEIMLAAKKRARRATPEEADRVITRIREKLVEIDAKEVAPMQGFVLKQAILTVKSKHEDAAKKETKEEVPEDGESSEDSRAAARKAREERRAASRAKQEQEAQRKEEERKKLLEQFPDWAQTQARPFVNSTTRLRRVAGDRYSRY